MQDRLFHDLETCRKKCLRFLQQFWWVDLIVMKRGDEICKDKPMLYITDTAVYFRLMHSTRYC